MIRFILLVRRVIRRTTLLFISTDHETSIATLRYFYIVNLGKPTFKFSCLFLVLKKLFPKWVDFLQSSKISFAQRLVVQRALVKFVGNYVEFRNCLIIAVALWILVEIEVKMLCYWMIFIKRLARLSHCVFLFFLRFVFCGGCSLSFETTRK